jgi:hypothetical protein
MSTFQPSTGLDILDKKALLVNYLKQQQQNPTSYSITKKSSEAFASSTDKASNWKSKRYEEAKSRSRQSLQAKRQTKTVKNGTPTGKKITYLPYETKNLISSPKKANVTKLSPKQSSTVLRDIKNSPQKRTVRDKTEETSSLIRELKNSPKKLPIHDKTKLSLKTTIPNSKSKQLNRDKTKLSLKTTIPNSKSKQTNRNYALGENDTHRKRKDNSTHQRHSHSQEIHPIHLKVSASPIESNDNVASRMNQSNIQNQIEKENEVEVKRQLVRSNVDQRYESFLNELTREIKFEHNEVCIS